MTTVTDESLKIEFTKEEVTTIHAALHMASELWNTSLKQYQGKERELLEKNANKANEIAAELADWLDGL